DAVVTAENSSGAIGFTGSLAPGKHSFKTSNAGITLTLPAALIFAIDAQTTFGTIANQFSLKKTNAAKETELVGAVADNPAVSLTIRDSRGNIEIHKGK